MPYAAHRPEFTDVMDALSRGVFDEPLVGAYGAAGAGAGPAAGRRGAGGDVGCGTGHAIGLLAAAFPDSTFTGYDLAPDAIAQARTEAAGLANARFEVRDAARLEVEEPLDVVFVFDAVRAQADPAAVLEGSTPPSSPAACSSWWSRARPAIWPATWTTRWPRSCTGSAPCTA